MSTVKNPTFTFDLTQIQVVSFQCNQLFILNHKNIKYGLKIILKYEVSADIQYFAVSNRVYFLSNNIGIHFVFTYYFPMSSGIAPIPTCVVMILKINTHFCWRIQLSDHLGRWYWFQCKCTFDYSLVSMQCKEKFWGR